MDANLMILDLKKKLKEVLENSGLPSGVCMYVTKDVVRELEDIYEQNCRSAAAKEKAGEEDGESFY